MGVMAYFYQIYRKPGNKLFVNYHLVNAVLLTYQQARKEMGRLKREEGHFNYKLMKTAIKIIK